MGKAHSIRRLVRTLVSLVPLAALVAVAGSASAQDGRAGSNRRAAFVSA
jgi:hypothetical protein